jgi:hypothetical protein
MSTQPQVLQFQVMSVSCGTNKALCRLAAVVAHQLVSQP